MEFGPYTKEKEMRTKPGDEMKMPAGRAIVTRVENGRIYFRYIRNGKLSSVERTIPEAPLGARG
jgi:hypothetical protein